MFEIELKFAVNDATDLRAALERLDAQRQPRQQHRDVYYRHPCRDFVATGEALRLRTIDERVHVTYKGPIQPGEVKTRRELEFPLDASDRGGRAMAAMFQRLGFVEVAEVRKVREPFVVRSSAGRPLSLVIDTVERLGQFAEVEGIAADPAEVEEVQGDVTALAEQLGLRNVERRSYLRQLLELASNPPPHSGEDPQSTAPPIPPEGA